MGFPPKGRIPRLRSRAGGPAGTGLAPALRPPKPGDRAGPRHPPRAEGALRPPPTRETAKPFLLRASWGCWIAVYSRALLTLVSESRSRVKLDTRRPHRSLKSRSSRAALPDQIGRKKENNKRKEGGGVPRQSRSPERRLHVHVRAAVVRDDDVEVAVPGVSVQPLHVSDELLDPPGLVLHCRQPIKKNKTLKR